MQVWCGFGPSHERARERVASAMEELYRLPFARFERYVPAGPPAEVAGALAKYVAAGCRRFNLVPVAPTVEESVDGVAEVRSLLDDAAGGPPAAGGSAPAAAGGPP